MKEKTGLLEILDKAEAKNAEEVECPYCLLPTGFNLVQTRALNMVDLCWKDGKLAIAQSPYGEYRPEDYEFGPPRLEAICRECGSELLECELKEHRDEYSDEYE